MSAAFETELQQIFLDEATQLLADAEQCFLAIEKDHSDPALLDKIFRMAHNLKGSANAVGFYALGELTHEMESFLLKLKSGELLFSRSALDVLLQCNDLTTTMVQGLRGDPHAVFDITAMVTTLRDCAEGKTADQPAVSPQVQAGPEAEADAVEGFHLFAAPELAAAAPTPAQVAVKPPTDDSIRVSLQRVEKLLNFVGEQVILHTVLKEQILSLPSNPLLRKTIHQLGKVTKEVQTLAMSLRMVPLRTTFQKMQRIVRDTSVALSKDVTLVISGDDTEVDKTVLEMLSDPLVHLIRNAVDHGIEAGDARVAAGKPALGTVRLRAYHRGDHLLIEVADDGAGLDAGKLKAMAIERGLLQAGSDMSDQAAYQLIFMPGFSTKTVVTDVSGRGVGMDVVKTNVERIQGSVLVRTVLGEGTTFTISVPLTLAIIDGLIVRSGSERFVLPLTQVYESKRPTLADVHSVSGAFEVYTLRGEDLPLYRLTHLLGQQPKPAAASLATSAAIDGIVIVVRNQHEHFAVLVDDIISQIQVVIKPLGSEHAGLRGFGGSAILGDGRAVLILELPDLVARRPQGLQAAPRRISA